MINSEILKNSILIFTDGACKGNPGPGGWGTIVAFPEGRVKELGNGYDNVTNNQMEMQAVISGLESIRDVAGDVAVFTDSTYVIQGITQWIFAWKQNNWVTAGGSPVSNQEFWVKLDKLVFLRKNLGKITWHYVRGHQGTPGNERVDEIASELAIKNWVDFYDGPLLQYGHAIHDIPEDTSLPTRSKDSKSNSKKKAHSYLSYVDGVFTVHKTWAECEQRVKGRSGAKFKKAMSAADEITIRKSWGLD